MSRTIKGSRSKRESRGDELYDALRRAGELIERGAWVEARALLESLSSRYPRDVDVLSNLLEVYYSTNDMPRYQRVCKRLVELAPGEPDLLASLAGVYLLNEYPALALRTFHEYLSNYPHHERADETRKMLPSLEATVGELLDELQLPREQALEIALLHEELRVMLDEGDLPQARKLGESLLRRWPDFVPALNNMSLINVFEGRFQAAIYMARRVLTLQPGNIHALSNLVRYCCLSGNLEEAEQWGEQLRATQPKEPDWYLKKVEGLSFIGDDAGVVETFESAMGDKELKPLLDEPIFYHLAAVAYMRLGRTRKARSLWNQALKLEPAFGLALGNLEDLRKPLNERYAPWPFSMDYWLTQRAKDDLRAMLPTANAAGAGKADKADKAGKGAPRDEVLERAFRRFLRKHVEIEGLLPALLDRGDRAGREFALRMAELGRTPKMLQALCDFALSTRGPDARRRDAAHTAAEEGLIPPGPVRLWQNGDWRELLIFGFNITHEPTIELPEQIEGLMLQALQDLRNEKGEEAERLLKQALDSPWARADSPGVASVLNNLASAYEMQGRPEEAEDLLRQITEKYPDYFFAHVALARKVLKDAGEGETEAEKQQRIAEAHALLEPLLSRRNIHYSEFAALCSTQIDLSLLQADRQTARSWLHLWESTGEDDLRIGLYRLKIGWRTRVRKLASTSSNETTRPLWRRKGLDEADAERD